MKVTLLVLIGTGITLFGCLFLALQFISGTPLLRGYAHATALIGGGLVVMQIAWLISSDPLYFIGGVCGIVSCLLLIFIAYTRDRARLRLKSSRQGRRLAYAHFKEILAS